VFRDDWTVFVHRNFVVSAPNELHETEPVAEWINHQRQSTYL